MDIFINLIITALFYLIIPLTLKFGLKKNFTNGWAWTISFANFFLIKIIFLLFFDIKFSSMSAYFYPFIVYFILVHKINSESNKKDKIKKDDSEIQKLVEVLEEETLTKENLPNNELLNNVETSTQITENISDDKVIEKTNKIKKDLSINTVLLIIIILFVCVTIFITSFYIYTNYKNIEKENDSLKKQISSLKTDYYSLQAKYNDSWQENLGNSSKLKFMDNYIVIVPSNTRIYHKYTCTYLDKTSKFLAFNIENAIGQGYKACNNCIK